jgi:hypothetical protein
VKLADLKGVEKLKSFFSFSYLPEPGTLNLPGFWGMYDLDMGSFRDVEISTPSRGVLILAGSKKAERLLW